MAVGLTAGQRLRADLEAHVIEAQADLNDSDEELEWVWGPRELSMLGSIEATADRIEDLEALVAGQGLMIAGSAGQLRLHPAVQEVRMARDVLGRLLDRLRLPSDISSEDGKPKDPVKQAAANRRWGLERGY